MTYSIIGRDHDSGEVGIAVESRWFHAGQDLAWIEPGIGAVCTQAMIEPTYGFRGLQLLREGRNAEEALAELTAADGGRDIRQVAIADADGRYAQHTGSGCVAAAGHATGNDCCAQGNMLASDSCWGAMVAAFEETGGNLTDRLLAALDAAEEEGGDARGRQAARIVVRPPHATGIPWQDRVIDLQVVDHPDPVPELRRLVNVSRAYDHLGKAFELVDRGDVARGLDEAAAAQTLAPGDDQITFWRASFLGGAGRVEEAAKTLREATQAHPGWPEFLRRCIDAGLAPPEARTLVDRIGS